MVLIARLALALCAVALVACAETDETVRPPPGGCAGADWRAAGVRDGEAGRGPERLEGYRGVCGPDAPPDAAAWEAGRLAGLQRYCTPENAYRLGQQGRLMAQVCPAETTSELDAENLRGFERSQELRTYRGFPDDLNNTPTRVNRHYAPREPRRW